MKHRIRTWASHLFKFSVSVGIIWWLVATDRLELETLRPILSPSLFLVCFTLVTVSTLLASERWRMLVRAQNIPGTAFSVFRLTLIGTFFNFAMPGGVGGDIVKAWYFAKDNPRAKVPAVTSVFLDRVLGLYTMAGMAALAILVDLDHVMSGPVLKSLAMILLPLFFCFTLGLWLIFSRRIHRWGLMARGIDFLPFGEKLIKVYKTANAFSSHRKTVFGVLLVSFASQCLSIFCLWLVGRAAGFSEVGLWTYFLVAPIGFMATAIPISPAGIGVGQAAFYFLFNLYLGKQVTLGPTVITALQGLQVLLGLIGALFYLQRKDRVSMETIEAT
ncbi:MAG: flippase-like domain-containing protein [Bdellovibrionaceae bacterium]|nr:flippase-like domain-containing protein [Pseudobdellovibrionaceae bacterium]